MFNLINNHTQSSKISSVLVVDDDWGIRTLLRQILEQQGYEVIEAEDGRQALEICQSLQPEVVLLDILMPIMDGVTCCQQLHALYGDQIAILMISNLHDLNSINRAFEAGAIDYMVKPIRPLILSQKVLKIMQQTSAVRQLQQINVELERSVQAHSLVLEERTGQLQRALALETILKRITDRVRDSLDETQILQTAVEELAVAMDTIRCNASLYDHEQRVSSVCYEQAIGSTLYHSRVLKMDAFPEVYQSLLQGVCTQFCSIELFPEQEQTSMFVFPIQQEEQSIGDIWLVCKPRRTLDALERRLIQQVANQCAIALRQSRLYQAAQTQIKELKQLNQVKDNFLHVVSHELRSPVTNILMAAQMLEKLVFSTKEPQSNTVPNSSNYAKGLSYLQIIQTECDREINFIDSLLDLQELEAESQSDRFTLIDLKKWLHDLTRPFLAQTQPRQQTLSLHLPVDLPSIEINPHLLNRILTELLHNACKYTPSGETITLSVSCDPTFKTLQISVTNTGIEIPLEEHDRIFDRFYRIPSSDRWGRGGSGLGLAIVKQAVKSLDGSVQVKSFNRQTCFTVQIPL